MPPRDLVSFKMENRVPRLIRIGVLMAASLGVIAACGGGNDPRGGGAVVEKPKSVSPQRFVDGDEPPPGEPGGDGACCYVEHSYYDPSGTPQTNSCYVCCPTGYPYCHDNVPNCGAGCRQEYLQCACL